MSGLAKHSLNVFHIDKRLVMMDNMAIYCKSNLSKLRIIKLNLSFKLSYLSSKFALTLGYLKPALNNHLQDACDNLPFLEGTLNFQC